MPVIGFLHSASAAAYEGLVAAFRKGLSEAGYSKVRMLRSNFAGAKVATSACRRWRRSWFTGSGYHPHTRQYRRNARGQGGNYDDSDRLLERRRSDQNWPRCRLNRPGGNVTGVSDIGVQLAAKRLGLLHELLPGAARFGLLVNPSNPGITEPFVTEVQTAASVIGRQIEVVAARTDSDIDKAFATLVNKRADAFLVSTDALFVTRRVQLVTLAARHAVPATYFRREFAEAGGLMSYGSNLGDQFRQTGIYTGRVLKGEKPADMPVVQPTRFELVINLPAARAIGIVVPPSLLAQADEVIE